MPTHENNDDVVNLPPLDFSNLPASIDDISQSEVQSIEDEDYDKREKEQRLKEAKEAHILRIKHLGRLYWLSLFWIISLFTVVILQGFKKFPFPFFTDNYKHLPFELTDTVLVAFMTTTTTTVLGLYGIGAFWLYKRNGAPKESVSKSDESS